MFYWRNALDRAVKTLAQSAAAVLIAQGTDLIHADWLQAVGVAGMASLLSLLTSIGGASNAALLPANVARTPTQEPQPTITESTTENDG